MCACVCACDGLVNVDSGSKAVQHIPVLTSVDTHHDGKMAKKNKYKKRTLEVGLDMGMMIGLGLSCGGNGSGNDGE